MIKNRICHVTSAHKRYDVRVFEKECCSLAAAGYEVYLIVNDDKEDEFKDGVHIVSTHFSPSNRKERMVTSMKYIFELMKKVDASVYHFHDPELLQLVNKMKGMESKLIFDAHEDTSVQIMDKDWIPYPMRRAVAISYKAYSSQRLRKCDGIISVTPAIVDGLRKYCSTIEMITNYPVISEEESVAKRSDKKYVFFAGGIDVQWCHLQIIQAVDKLDGIKYIIAGSGDEGYLEKMKAEPGWKNAEFLGKIPHSEVNAIYCGAIAGVAVNKASQIKGEGTLGNTKLFEIMAASIPVICTDYRLWKQIIEENNCGICVDPDDVSEIAKAIEYLEAHPEEAAQMGANGRRAVREKYNWQNEAKKLALFYEKVLEK